MKPEQVSNPPASLDSVLGDPSPGQQHPSWSLALFLLGPAPIPSRLLPLRTRQHHQWVTLLSYSLPTPITAPAPLLGPNPNPRGIALLCWSTHQSPSRWVTHLPAGSLPPPGFCSKTTPPPNPFHLIIFPTTSPSSSLHQTPQAQIQSTPVGRTAPTALPKTRLVLSTPEKDSGIAWNQTKSSHPRPPKPQHRYPTGLEDSSVTRTLGHLVIIPNPDA